MDEKIQCLLRASVSDWQILKELSQLDRATAITVAADWVSIFQQHHKRYIPGLGEEDLETLARRIVLRRDAPTQDWKRTYVKLYWYIREGTFYRMKDPQDILWKHLIHTPQVIPKMPDVHLWNNILFMSALTENGDTNVRVFDCARLQELQTLSQVRVAAVCCDTVYLFHPHAISARRGADMHEIASVGLDAHLDWNDVEQWVSDNKYSAYIVSRRTGDELHLCIPVRDSVSLQQVRAFEGPILRMGGGFYRYVLDVHGDDVILYIQSSEGFKDADAEIFGQGQWALSFNVRTGEQKQVLHAGTYDACGMCEVVDHSLITGREKSPSLLLWSAEGPGCADLGPDDHLDGQSPLGSMAKVGDHYLYVTSSYLCDQSTLRVHNPWRRWHTTKDILDVEEGEEEPAKLAANEWFVVLVMEQRIEHADEAEVDSEFEYEYTLKIARVTDHVFIDHDVDSESSSEEYGDSDEELERA